MFPRPTYEVFLSFRGTDTRNYFAKLLHMMLKKAFIDAFIDKENLEKGKDTNNELINVINHSMISIPIISEGYASSNSCLMELEHMLKCMDEKNHVVIPIFYYINPSDVRQCEGPFTKSLLGRKDKHDHIHIDDTVIDSWESALKRVGRITGHHLHKENEVEHGEMIDQIIYDVRRKLKKEDLLTEKLVGVDPHVKRIMGMLDVDYRKGQANKIGDTHEKVLVIHGLAGVGKTALAKHVYNQLHHLFEACSFQDEIEERSILSVQNKLISDLLKRNDVAYDHPDKALIYIQGRFEPMKVLLLLDGVKCPTQLRKLVGKLDWLGPGSRVILTSRREDEILRQINGAESFHLEPMKQDEALILFCRKAFRTDSPLEEFRNLSADIVAATGGLPATLEIVGLFLLNVTSEEVWRETLTKLGKGLNEGVNEILKKSYDELSNDAQQIFLDIACFFSGNDRRIPFYMWRDCACSPATSILALRGCSLIETQDEKLCMLEILKKFGRRIVNNENPQSCERSRLWNHGEALTVLQSKKGTDKVKALMLEFGDRSKTHISFRYAHLSGLQKLSFLKLDRADIQGDFQNCLPDLRWLDWQGPPGKFSGHLKNLNLQKLVILDLSWSQVDKDWGGWKLLVKAGKLKVLKLTGCSQLIDTPKFFLSMKLESSTEKKKMELERLTLEDCSRLAFTDQSFSYLDKLVSLNMKQCRLLSKLPNLGFMTCLEELVIDGTSISQIDFQKFSMKMLKTLSARDCKDLTKVSNLIGYLESLMYLALDCAAIQTLPESIGLLEKLRTLSLKNCHYLTHLPNGIGKLKSLQFLDLSNTVIRELPPIDDWKAMKVLRMARTFIEEFPEAILNLGKLEEIDFSFCRSLKGSIQDLDIWKLSSLTILKLSYTEICCLPKSFYRLSCLQELDIMGCNNLQRLPKLPSSSPNVRCNFDLSMPDPHVMIQGVGQKRRQDQRERGGETGKETWKKGWKGKRRRKHAQGTRKEGVESEKTVHKRKREGEMLPETQRKRGK